MRNFESPISILITFLLRIYPIFILDYYKCEFDQISLPAALHVLLSLISKNYYPWSWEIRIYGPKGWITSSKSLSHSDPIKRWENINHNNLTIEQMVTVFLALSVWSLIYNSISHVFNYWTKSVQTEKWKYNMVVKYVDLVGLWISQ